jgi:hypothetical protein
MLVRSSRSEHLVMRRAYGHVLERKTPKDVQKASCLALSNKKLDQFSRGLVGTRQGGLVIAILVFPPAVIIPHRKCHGAQKKLGIKEPILEHHNANGMYADWSPPRVTWSAASPRPHGKGHIPLSALGLQYAHHLVQHVESYDKAWSRHGLTDRYREDCHPLWYGGGNVAFRNLRLLKELGIARRCASMGQ